MAEENPNLEGTDSSSKTVKIPSLRMQRYHSDPIYRAKVIASSSAARKKRLQNDEEFRRVQAKQIKELKSRLGLKRKPESIKRARKRHAVKAKSEVYAALGSICACCGEDNPAFLTIDHIHGDGRQHRLQIGPSTGTLYAAIRREGCPQDKYRILCMNCNFATRYGQPCPHELEVKKIIHIGIAS